VADPSWNIYTINGGASMSTAGYNNSLSIFNGSDSNGNNYNTEMLVSKGGLITRGYDSTAFINYSTYYDNSFDYSNIASDTSIRYSTFVWKVVKPTSGTYTKINLRLTFDTGTTFIAKTTAPTIGYQIIYGGNTSNINIYYRIEDALLISPTVAVPSTNVSSSWINGNTTTGLQVSSSNYHNTSAKFGLYTNAVSNGTISSGINSGKPFAIFPLRVPAGNIASNSRDQYLYIKISSQNNTSFKILNVETQLAAL
jgi:hypothetical protein